MKFFRLQISGALSCIALYASFTPANAGMAMTQQTQKATATAPGDDRLTPTELEQLVGAIALYPDPLLANVLAASVYSDEVAEAAKFCATKPPPTKEQIKAKGWEDPVKGVAEIPDAIKMMGDYPDWTIALGQAYLTQAKDIMDTVQRLRKKANDNGALVTTPQQKVVVEQSTVYIQPADPEIIYVPTYSPSVVYVDHHDDDWVAGAIGFGVGITCGLIWANNMDCHWHGGCVGWGGSWGHSDVDIDIEGDVNVGNKNFEGGDRTRETNREGGDRTTNVQGGDRTNVQGGNRTNAQGGDRNASRNRVGNEGNAWSPNKSKSLASSKPSQSSKLKSGSTNRMSTPGAGGAGAGNRGGAAGGAAANRGGAGAGGAGGANRPSTGAKPSGASGTRQTAKPAAGASRVPQNRPPSASQRSGGSGSAYGGGSNTRADSNRGSSSRNNSAGRSSGGGSRSSGGGSRGGGGGSRGGGGGRGGGGRR